MILDFDWILKEMNIKTDKILVLIPQWTVRSRPFSRSKGYRSQFLQTTNPLIARPLSGSPNCAWY